jgi:hypothetical protein
MPSAGFSTCDSDRFGIRVALTNEETVHRALARVLGDPSITTVGGMSLRSDTALADLGVDNLARVLLLDACADMGVIVDEHAAWMALTVGDLVESVQQ